MRKITVLAVGGLKKGWIKEGVVEYLERINRFVQVKMLEIRGSNLREEAEHIISRIDNEFVVALTEEGEQMDSLQFAELVDNMNKDLVFVIGSAEGLHEKVKERADKLLSLSKMTFPHEMARLVFVEQLYRAFTIISNHPYHK